MNKIKILSVFVILSLSISCDMAVESIKEKATKIWEEKKIEADSSIHLELENTINEVDTLFNHQKK